MSLEHIRMKEKIKSVFSPHHISERNEKLSLIQITSFEVNNKIVVKPIQISGRNKNFHYSPSYQCKENKFVINPLHISSTKNRICH